MAICVVALFVFGFLSLFSVRYRPLAKEAFSCVFSMATLRPCRTNLNQKIKSYIVSKLMIKSPKVARIVYRNFEILSLAFTVLFLVSMIYSAYAIYNLIVYSNCNGPAGGSCPITTPTTTCPNA